MMHPVTPEAINIALKQFRALYTRTCELRQALENTDCITHLDDGDAIAAAIMEVRSAKVAVEKQGDEASAKSEMPSVMPKFDKPQPLNSHFVALVRKEKQYADEGHPLSDGMPLTRIHLASGARADVVGACNQACGKTNAYLRRPTTLRRNRAIKDVSRLREALDEVCMQYDALAQEIGLATVTDKIEHWRDWLGEENFGRAKTGDDGK